MAQAFQPVPEPSGAAGPHGLSVPKLPLVNSTMVRKTHPPQPVFSQGPNVVDRGFRGVNKVTTDAILYDFAISR